MEYFKWLVGQNYCWSPIPRFVLNDDFAADNRFRQWSISRGSLIRSIPGFTDEVAYAVVRDNDIFFEVGYKAYWSISGGYEIRTFVVGSRTNVDGFAISEKYLFTECEDKTIKQWSISSGKLIASFTGFSFYGRSFAASGSYLFSGSGAHIINKFDYRWVYEYILLYIGFFVI